MAANYANNSLPLSTLLRYFVLASTYKGLAQLIRPFLNSSGRVNYFVVLAVLVQASLKQFKVGLFAPLHSLEGLLLVRVPVAPRLWRIKQFDDFLLQGSTFLRLLLSRGGVLLLGLSRPILGGADHKRFEAVN